MSNSQNDRPVTDYVGAALTASMGDIAYRTSAGRSIARIVEPHTLSPRKLEERKLINREESVRKQADAFRELRTRLLAIAPDRNFVTMIAPISHGCGGSFVARNLAIAFAFDEAKTALLIDCDVRHPAQHTALGVEPENGGLINYLEHPALGIEKVLYHTGIPRLRLIPVGRQREMVRRLYAGDERKEVVDGVR